MTTVMASTAQPMAPRSRAAMARAMYEPMPGRVTVVLPTLIASAATTKNHPPDIDIIMFQMSAGMANGTSRRQKRIHGPRWKARAASSSSAGMLRRE